MLFYTTCGWMMWNWMASSLFAGAAIVLTASRCVTELELEPDAGPPSTWVARRHSARPAPSSTRPGPSSSGRRHLGPHLPGLPRARDAVRVARHVQTRVVFSTGSPLTDEDFKHVYAKVKSMMSWRRCSISGARTSVRKACARESDVNP